MSGEKKGDKSLSTKKGDLIAVNRTTMNGLSPQVNPCSCMIHSNFVVRDDNCGIEDTTAGKQG